MANNNRKKAMAKGLALLISFSVVFVILFMPWFGDGMTGLEYSDDLFNKLSKGSSNFFAEIEPQIDTLKGKELDVTYALKKKEYLDKAPALLAAVGLYAKVEGEKLSVKGDAGKSLSQILVTAHNMYDNDGKKVSEFYKTDEKQAMTILWNVLNDMIIPLQKKGQIEEAKVINTVVKKGIEPAYNFYGIPTESVKTKAGTVLFLLAFYVIYTLWYGFGIFEVFEGLGLSMKKSKVKKEV